MISVLFILVVLAALGTALAAISTRQQLGSAMDLENARAYQSARAGLEWAAWQVLRNPAPPAAAPACFGSNSFSPGGTLSGFVVTITCTRTPTTGLLPTGGQRLQRAQRWRLPGIGHARAHLRRAPGRLDAEPLSPCVHRAP